MYANKIHGKRDKRNHVPQQPPNISDSARLPRVPAWQAKWLGRLRCAVVWCPECRRYHYAAPGTDGIILSLCHTWGQRTATRYCVAVNLGDAPEEIRADIRRQERTPYGLPHAVGEIYRLALGNRPATSEAAAVLQ